MNSFTSEGVIGSDDLVNEDTDSVEGIQVLLEEDINILNLDYRFFKNTAAAMKLESCVRANILNQVAEGMSGQLEGSKLLG